MMQCRFSPVHLNLFKTFFVILHIHDKFQEICLSVGDVSVYVFVALQKAAVSTIFSNHHCAYFMIPE
jgi:hypothetical protein